MVCIISPLTGNCSFLVSGRVTLKVSVKLNVVEKYATHEAPLKEIEDEIHLTMPGL